MESDAAYSICRILLGISFSNLNDAWTTSGLIATTPPLGTMQSTGETRVANSWMLSSLSTPTVCVPGKIRKGPFSTVESSKLTRSASTWLSAVTGACA